jgi:hypothetical protein
MHLKPLKCNDPDSAYGHRTSTALPSPAARTCRIARRSTSSPSSGNLVFTTATIAAYTEVKPGDAIWLFMTERANRPRPRTRFSPNISGRMFFRLAVFTWRRNHRSPGERQHRLPWDAGGVSGGETSYFSTSSACSGYMCAGGACLVTFTHSVAVSTEAHK